MPSYEEGEEDKDPLHRPTHQRGRDGDHKIFFCLWVENIIEQLFLKILPSMLFLYKSMFKCYLQNDGILDRRKQDTYNVTYQQAKLYIYRNIVYWGL